MLFRSPLQLLDAILEFDDFRFIDFERGFDGRAWSAASRGCKGPFPSGQPHDEDHQNGESHEQPGLHVLWQQSRWLRAFVMDRWW